MKRLATLLVLLPFAAAAQSNPGVPEEIGTWRVTCAQDRMTDRAECQMRHRQPVEQAQGAGASLLLEVVPREGRLVPAVTARDLGVESMQRGLLALTGNAQLRFAPNRLIEMPCGIEGRSLVCAPTGAEAERAAAELEQATTALVRVTGLGGGTVGEPVELRLERTRDALARFRARAPEAAAAAAPPPAGFGLNLPEILLRLQRLFGQ